MALGSGGTCGWILLHLSAHVAIPLYDGLNLRTRWPLPQTHELSDHASQLPGMFDGMFDGVFDKVFDGTFGTVALAFNWRLGLWLLVAPTPRHPLLACCDRLCFLQAVYSYGCLPVAIVFVVFEQHVPVLSGVDASHFSPFAPLPRTESIAVPPVQPQLHPTKGHPSCHNQRTDILLQQQTGIKSNWQRDVSSNGQGWRTQNCVKNVCKGLHMVYLGGWTDGQAGGQTDVYTTENKEESYGCRESYSRSWLHCFSSSHARLDC